MKLWSLLLFLVIFTACSRRDPSVNAASGAGVIYGTDSRIEAPLNTPAAPATAAFIHAQNVSEDQSTAWARQLAVTRNLCSEVRFREQPNLSHCSGVLVGPDLVLTAQHCLRSDLACSNTKMIFGWTKSAMKFTFNASLALFEIKLPAVYSCSEILWPRDEKEGETADLALIRLDRAVEGVTPVKLPQATLADGESVVVYGHPNGVPLKESLGKVVRHEAHEYLLESDTFSGDSGAGVYSAKDGSLKGVMIGGEHDYVLDPRGCYVTHVCKDAKTCSGEIAIDLATQKEILKKFFENDR